MKSAKIIKWRKIATSITNPINIHICAQCLQIFAPKKLDFSSPWWSVVGVTLLLSWALISAECLSLWLVLLRDDSNCIGSNHHHYTDFNSPIQFHINIAANQGIFSTSQIKKPFPVKKCQQVRETGKILFKEETKCLQMFFPLWVEGCMGMCEGSGASPRHASLSSIMSYHDFSQAVPRSKPAGQQPSQSQRRENM